jgi:menaquinol-cytochrome c reductase iron-sulfur subunit
LGCTVNYNSNPQYPNQFFCPCHFGRYTKDGTNVPGTPPAKPLDRYETKVEGGYLYIGPLKQS